ncbi:flagellar filament capping protein FliD [Desulfovibrio cuneatus]|uniref:flagellar filament capping protein FliD n=1 Tax=Desulfovibrio cuneatus TaxID=159728 RepID=UPI00040F1394|nr:flagellar filament capping protein FliD [Desulfovibrio cuneatus]
MAIMSGGTINFDKLGTETDFSELTKKLLAVEQRYGKQLISWKSDWTKRIEAFGKIRTELTSLRSTLSSLRSVDSFLVKNTVSSKPEVATATASSQALEGTYKVEVDTLATNAMWSINTGLANKNAVLNQGPATGVFTYTYKGEERTVNVPPGTTLEGFKNLINGNATHNGVKASIVQSSGGAVLQLQGAGTGEDSALVVTSSTIAALPVTISYANTWKMESGKATLERAFLGTDILNSSSGTQTFNFKYNGTSKTMQVPAGTTVDGFITKFNTENNPQMTASLNGSGYLEIAYSPTRSETPTPLPGDPLATVLANTYPEDSGNQPKMPSNTYTFKFDKDGDGVEEEHSFSLGADHTLNDIRDKINGIAGQDIASVSKTGTDYKLEVGTATYNNSFSISGTGSLEKLAYTPPTADGWLVQHAQNAKVRINGWPAEPEWLETASNTISDVVEGMTFNLVGEGTSLVSVKVDSAAITDNVKKFVDAVNKVRTLIKDLTKVDSQKDTIDPSFAESQSEMQKGSILTGNYGIQLLSSKLKQAVASSGAGFVMAQEVNGVLEGDIFSSLSQIGITTNSKEGDPNFGLLEIKEWEDDKGGLTFSQALAKDPMAIAELFSARSQGISHSPALGFNSHVASITKPGIYTVSYELDANGKVKAGTTPTINGKPAIIYYDDTGRPKQFGLSRDIGEVNDADGLFVDVYDLNEGAHTGQVAIRDGKVNELINMMDGEEGLLSREKGILGILEKNYQQIADNIEEKIVKEDERLKNWEVTTRLRFARLEEVLSKYNSLQASLKSQLAQLGQK